MANSEYSNIPPAKKIFYDEEQQVYTRNFTPREYQIELLELSKMKNIIACLGTGTGKTFIAIMLIREMAADARVPYENGGKKIVFLVPTVPLVQQQAECIHNFTDLKVKGYFGEMDVDSWSKEQWDTEFKEYSVLVMTAEICRIIVHHGFLPVSRIKLLIVDECHRAQGNHPYREVMKCFSECPVQDMPRVLGLSASLLNGKCKPHKFEKQICDLEKTLRSTVETATDVNSLKKYGTDPNEYLIFFNPFDCSLVGELLEILAQAITYCTKEHSYVPEEAEITYFTKPKKCLEQLKLILITLGSWCAYHAAEAFSKEIIILLKHLKEKNNEAVLIYIKDILKKFMEHCKLMNKDMEIGNIENLPHKLQRFLSIFREVNKNGDWFAADSVNTTSVNESILQLNSRKRRYMENPPKISNFCGIIFVEKRITAYILCKWLLEVSQKYSEYSFIEPNFVVGHGTMQKFGGSRETSMSFKQQSSVLRHFREKQFNFLVATSVVEEGMDIPKCNVVVRFDLPRDFRAYVQSKGRARAQNSVYILLAPAAEKETVIDDLSNFVTIEEMLLKRCHNRMMHNDEDIEDHMADKYLPAYMPKKGDGSPRITMSSAISLVNRYCAKLPCDMATKLAPKWEIHTLEDDGLTKEYVCTVWLPINSPIRKPVEGERMPQKRLAKMAAALKTCRLLHEKGELDENLLPIGCSVDDVLEDLLGSLEVEEVPKNGAQPGTQRRRQIYDKGVAESFKNSLPSVGLPCYLYVFDMKLVEPLPNELNPRKRPIVDPADTTQGFGILCTKKIPHICKFPVFTRSGKVMVDVKYADSNLVFTEDQLNGLSEFHRFIFSDVLWLEGPRKYFNRHHSNSTFYVVPVNNGAEQDFGIDWKFISYVKYHDYNEQKCDLKKAGKYTKFDDDLFSNAVITRSYLVDSWYNEPPVFHYVMNVQHDLSPNSVFPDVKYHTYKDYYKCKYNVDIPFDNQPLLNTERVASANLWKPCYINEDQIFDDDSKSRSNAKKRRENYTELLVPELCIIHPFPATLFRKAVCIPTVLFRVNSLLLAEQLRQSVTASLPEGMMVLHENYEWPEFNLETSDIKLKKILKMKGVKLNDSQDILNDCEDIVKSVNNEIVSFEKQPDLMNVPGPNPGLLLQALTVKNAGDEFNLERLETVGDSFLKYSISVKLYVSYPSFDEGKLTKLRSGIVRNLNLYQQAKKKSLAKFLISVAFDSKITWLPPCYTVDEMMDVEETFKNFEKNDMDENSRNKDVNVYLYKKQIISDKSIADSVEALIGAYLLSCGALGALYFMSWIGIKVFDDHSNGMWPPSVPNDPILNHDDGTVAKLQELTSGFEKFEEKICYKFKEKAYLLQAFTHASYSCNEITDCFQRLEFLGDAVLDYLVTRKLYDDPKKHSPGELTDLRSALVNNAYFASLAVKFEYHQYLKTWSPTLFKLIEEYVKLLQNSDAFKNFEEYGYYLEEDECFDIEEVEVPKSLGDIFESVAGAIYLDSGMSLDAVWKVYYPMMKPAIDHLSLCVPKAPVRLLLERIPNSRIFGEPQLHQGKVYITVTLPGGQVIIGAGCNKRVAKRSAAKRAYAELRKLDAQRCD